MYFCEILSQIMAEKGMTVAEVARACSLTDSTVRSIFDRKQKKVALSVAIKLSDGLGVSLQRLNGDPEEEPRPPSWKLSGEEQKLIEDFRRLDRAGKEYMLQTMAIALQAYSEKNNAVPSVETAR